MEKVLIRERQGFRYSLKRKLSASRFLIFMIIPAIIYYAVFCYAPMYGILLSFAKYSPRLGIWGSLTQQWIGFDNFKSLFAFPNFRQAIPNTLLIGSLKIIISFVSAILVALLINELRMRFFKKFVQITVTFPHFLSWVVVSSLFLLLFNSTGTVSHISEMIGGKPLDLFSNGPKFIGLLLASDIWKEAGWSSIIYLATMAGISTDLYEAADIDGASRLQKIWHITLPGIRPTAVLLLIMSVGGVLSAGFDQIFNMTSQLHNSAVMANVQIIDTLIYQGTLASGSLTKGESTALGLFKSVIGFILVIVTDRIAKACGERGII